MLKTICKNVAWMAIPLGLAMGCASNQPTTEASYAPAPALTPTSTSGEPEQRIYSSTQPGSTDITPAPQGADSANWTVAEAVRQKMLTDETLAPQGSSLIAEVGKDGMVTLKGRVASASEKDRVRETIASVPGVTGVNDEQLGVGRATGNGKINMQ